MEVVEVFIQERRNYKCFDVFSSSQIYTIIINWQKLKIVYFKFYGCKICVFNNRLDEVPPR